jgi:hypothetical protein
MEIKEMPLSSVVPQTKENNVRTVHDLVEVKTVLVDVTDGNGERKTMFGYVAGDQVVFVPNTGTPAQGWLRDAVLKKLSSKRSDTVGSI